MIGCAPHLKIQGDSRTLAVYSGATLAARMPARIDVVTAAAAGEAALEERGYIISRREGTSGRMVVVGKTPAAGWRRHTDRAVHFRAIRRPRGVRVEIHVGRVGDEAESRAILDATLASLGL